MSFGNRGVAAYRNVSVSSAVPYADSVHLIQMLFDGLLVSLADAEGHIGRNDIKAKTESIGRATKILNGLQGALDFEKGAEIAVNLSATSFCTITMIYSQLSSSSAFNIIFVAI